jgi:hypothetical protein
MTLPNFLIIGAAKAGTTLLYDQLRRHPEIFMPEVKEPCYFAYEGKGSDFRYPAKTIEAYEALFARATDEKAIGEASPQYLYRPNAAGRIRATLPDVRLVVSLRDPVERSFSVYQHNMRNSGRNEGVPYGRAFETDPVLKRGFSDDLRRYLDLFGREAIKIILFDDLVRDNAGTLSDLLGFLGVSPEVPERLPEVANPGGLPRNRIVHAALQNRALRVIGRRFAPEAMMNAAKQLRSRNLVKQQMTAEERARARAFLRDDILRTQDLIGRDLSIWLEER